MVQHDAIQSPDCFFYNNSLTHDYSIQPCSSPSSHTNAQRPDDFNNPSPSYITLGESSTPKFDSPQQTKFSVPVRSVLLVPHPMTCTGYVPITTDSIASNLISKLLDLRSFKKYRKEPKITRVRLYFMLFWLTTLLSLVFFSSSYRVLGGLL